MKTYPLVLENDLHSSIKHSADIRGETIKDFIMKSIKARLDPADYIKSNKELQKDLKNKNKINFIEIDSIEELFN